MSQPFRKRVSFKLASASAIATLVLGAVLYFALAVIDYRGQQSELAAEMRDVLGAAASSAIKAVETSDEALAGEIVEGLLDTAFIVEARVVAEGGAVLSSREGSSRASDAGWLARAIVGQAREHRVTLHLPGDRPAANAGELWLMVDRARGLTPFFERWLRVGVGAAVTMLALGLMLFGAANAMVHKPLIELAANFDNVDLTQPGKTRLQAPSGHEDDELGLLSLSANRYLVASEKQLAESKRTEDALKERERRLQRVAENIPGLVFQRIRYPDGRFAFSYLSAGITRLHGLDPERVVAERSALLDIIHPEDREKHIAALNESADVLTPINMEIRHVGPDGGTIWMHTMSRPYRLDSGAIVWDGVSLDITERKRAEERIQYLAHYDVLTGLPNRESFLQNLRRTVAVAERERRKAQATKRSGRMIRQSRRSERTYPRARRPGTLFSVLFLDLDDFKGVNDTLGHGVGDLLLKAVADRLQNHMRRSDALARHGIATVSRLGGDEFTIILNNLESVDGAATAAQRIVEALSQPFSIEGHTIHSGTSIGVALYPDDGETAEQLLRNADLAMYRSKADKVSRYHFFAPQMNQEVLERKALERDLRDALRDGDLRLCYQPQVEVKSGTIAGMEALLRWSHPDRGEISPNEIIPAAETTNLILPIGEWVLAEACRQNKSWQEAGLPHLPVTVNVSGAQIAYQDVREIVEKVLGESALDPRYLHVEVTESVVISHLESALATMHGLREMGVKVYLDDFGTGFSSLSYLKRFPIDTLKIDRAFVRDITNNPDDAAIARAIITMAHSMDMMVTAEGVETEAQFEFLRAEGCDTVQGHYFSRPVPPDEFAELLRNEKGATARLADAD